MSELHNIKYDKNFLSKVIFRVDYHTILQIQNSVPADFQESIRKILPVLEEKKGVEYITKFSPGKAEHEDRPVSQWFFSDKEGRFKLTLTYGFLALDDFHYTSLSPYLGVIESVINAFSKAYESVDYTRIGLRYINNITIPNGDPLDWSDYISDSLTCPISEFVVNKRELSRAMSQFVLNKGDCSIVCNFGIFNGEFPDRISRKEFILDFDCHSQDVEAGGISAQLKRFNLLILELFEKSIKHELRKTMGGKRD